MTLVESRKAKQHRALQVLERLRALMPEATIELNFRNAWELLVAVVLSAQCTDRRVNLVTPALFERFPDAASMAASSEAEVAPYIRSLGLYQSKAKNLVAAARQLVAEHQGVPPLGRAALEELPGVGHKTAGVVSMHLGGDAAFPVDTHVQRLSFRLNFSSASQPDAVEADLQALFPQRDWFLGHQLLVWHGRRTCFARKPDCAHCAVAQLCPKRGV